MITVELVKSWEPCPRYTDARLKRLIGKGLTIEQVLRKRILARDRVWVAYHYLPKEVISKWLDIVVERAIRRCLGRSGSPKWEQWAEGWLDGSDRSAYAVHSAAYGAVHSAAYGAANATRAARVAYCAADYAAYWATDNAAYGAADNAAYWAASAAYGAAECAAGWDAERKQQIKDLREVLK